MIDLGARYMQIQLTSARLNSIELSNTTLKSMSGVVIVDVCVYK